MAEDNSAGFTVKEMLVRVETKLDVITADHEARIRRLEESRSSKEGEDNSRTKLSTKHLSWGAVVVALASAASQIAPYIHGG